MIDATNGIYFSFTTCELSWPESGEAIRLSLAAALEAAGAEIDTEMDPYESDWVFYGVHNEKKFTVVLSIVKFVPCNWFIFMEGATPTDKPDMETRRWAQPILDTTIRNRPGTTNFCWHETHETLRDLC